MKKLLLSALPILFCLPANAAGDKIVEANNLFGVELFQQSSASEKDRDTNVLISPLSALVALGMAQSGAEGITQSEILSAMQLAGMSSEEANKGIHRLVTSLLDRKSEETTLLANSIWGNRDHFKFSNSFESVLKKYYASSKDFPAFNLPFSNPDTLVDLNKWVETNTKGMIPKILDSLSPDMAAVLLNALFFQAKWQDPFSTRTTYKTATVKNGQESGKVPFFQMASGKKTAVSMMHNSEAQGFYRDSSSFELVSLPFCGKSDFPYPGAKVKTCRDAGDYVLDLILPKVEARKLAEKFPAAEYGEAVKKAAVERLDLHVPKFKFGYGAEQPKSFVPFLNKLGMKKAFTSSAEMTPMGKSSVSNVFLDQVLQKTAVEMEEGGFKAAAVTAVTATTESANVVPSKRIAFDRPFLFVLRDTKTGALPFFGLVANPQWK